MIYDHTTMPWTRHWPLSTSLFAPLRNEGWAPLLLNLALQRPVKTIVWLSWNTIYHLTENIERGRTPIRDHSSLYVLSGRLSLNNPLPLILPSRPFHSPQLPTDLKLISVISSPLMPTNHGD